MTPNDLDAYLKVFTQNGVASGILKLAGGVEIHAVLVPTMPAQLGEAPTPGGWKAQMAHLDNPEDLRPDLEYKGTLP